jgi:hypothetical protein
MNVHDRQHKPEIMKSKIHEHKNSMENAVSKAFIILLFTIGFNSSLLFGGTFTDPEKPNPTEKSAWTKAEKGSWLGGYKLWYKFDTKNNQVKFSHNKRRWNTASNAAWQDKQGRWLFIYDGKLMSNNDGATWVEVTDRTWQDLNGNWYRLNQNWELEETVVQESMATAH